MDIRSRWGTQPGHAVRARGFGLSHDAWGRLVLIDAEGRRFVGVEPVRGVPDHSIPATGSRSATPKGAKSSPSSRSTTSPRPVRQTLEDELALREFIPIIQRIVRVSADSFPSDWDVETDRGPTRFTLDNEDDVRRLGPHRVMITDARRLRYQIPDTRALDPESRRLLERSSDHDFPRHRLHRSGASTL